MTITKLLIANRGEIACRIIRTAKEMGIATVAVFSDADRNAWHVDAADEAVRIGPPPASESYLNADAILSAARRTGADAIHPGYGFLSENPDFVTAVEDAGLIFVGPSSDAIRAMGLKDAAKRRMEAAGVPVVPGYHGEEQDPKFLATEADRLGYPVLVKARAGGGGKGMRKVERASDFSAALESARAEAEAAFADPRCLIEKYVEKPRHIEVQVFGDSHGNAVHLFERDCSLQRRHQKVIEEAPAPGMTAEMRGAMGEAAVRAAKAIGYAGAGTIEFIADTSEGLRPDRFYFMEMNTRLQVEHPVTEAITGLDLVAWQIRVAGGERLPLAQDQITIGGHAFEARIYAEDADAGFLPATGRLKTLVMPVEGPGLRVDSGVRAGDTITPYYDPMIAKLIVHGRDRAAALGRLRRALKATRIAGTVTNVSFLARLAAHEGFAAGDFDTGLIDRDRETLVRMPGVSPAAEAIAALAALERIGCPSPDRTGGPTWVDPFVGLADFRNWGTARQIVRFTADDDEREVYVEACGEDRFAVRSGPGEVEVAVIDGCDPMALRLEIAGHRFSAAVAREGGERRTIVVYLEEDVHRFALFDAEQAGDDVATGDHVQAPMPGTVRRIAVAVGDEVAAGDALIVLEAMKMEHTLTSPRGGTVAELTVAVGDPVENGAVLLSLEMES